METTLMESPRHTPMPYRIETARLVLRCWNPGDAPLLKEAVDSSLDHLRPWLPWAHNEPVTLEEKYDFLRMKRAEYDTDKDYTMAIFTPEEDRVLGGTGLHKRGRVGITEIGYFLRASEVGKGYVTEASTALACIALGYLKIPRLEIRCDPMNIDSRKVPERLGFVREGLLRSDNRDGEGNLRDTEVWSLLATEFAQWPLRNFPFKAWDAVGRQVI